MTDDLERDIPRYIILSHTWDRDNENKVTFQDLVNSTDRGKSGFEKIESYAV